MRFLCKKIATNASDTRSPYWAGKENAVPLQKVPEKLAREKARPEQLVLRKPRSLALWLTALNIPETNLRPGTLPRSPKTRPPPTTQTQQNVVTRNVYAHA